MSETGGMPKAERKKQILTLLAETGLALPPRVVYENLAMEGATFSYKTVHRHLKESVDEGLAENPAEKESYYRITEKGRRFLADDPDASELDSSENGS